MVTLNPYQQYIVLSRYSRWRDDLKRRETWEEVVDRYTSFFSKKYGEVYPSEQIGSFIKDLKVMPSMRCLMTAGPALERDQVAGFNCTYLAIDHPRAFDEILYLLMCGCGVGFSVERQFIASLPVINEDFYNVETVIQVHDSRIGWSTAFRQLIALLYAGQIPRWDLTRLRPKGARLKTFRRKSEWARSVKRTL